MRRREFEDYASSKAREIDEQRNSWRYYHVDQWTNEQLEVLKKRHQPAITFDRTGRKIDSLSGTIRRLRTDPKAYPNTPKGEQGAEVATQVIRTINDASFAEDLEVECCRDALIHGFGVDELILGTGETRAIRTSVLPMWIPRRSSTTRAVSDPTSRTSVITASTNGPTSTNWIR